MLNYYMNKFSSNSSKTPFDENAWKMPTYFIVRLALS